MAGRNKNSNKTKNTTERVVLRESGIERTVEVGKDKYKMINNDDEVFSSSES